MTIMASHFAIVLGAWRLRVRIDIDEPRESELAEGREQAQRNAPTAAAEALRVPTWGRGTP
jgi:hypothetical protein